MNKIVNAIGAKILDTDNAVLNDQGSWNPGYDCIESTTLLFGKIPWIKSRRIFIASTLWAAPATPPPNAAIENVFI